jgi:hypothetical protein
MHSLRSAFAELCASSSLASSLGPGQLTAAEYLASGDWLCENSGGLWGWGAGDAECRSAAFPVGQQFLQCTLAVPPSGAGVAACGEESEGGFAVVAAGAAAAPAASGSAADSVTVALHYDFWWRTPRCFLYSATLGPSAILTRLVAADQGGATATLEALPLHRGGLLSVSLHPCKHAAVMASLMQGKAPHLYVCVLLKVLANALPLLPIDAVHC